jgi:hypothetical protein
MPPKAGDHDLVLAPPRRLGARSGSLLLILSLPALLLLEWSTGDGFSLSLFYLFPVGLAAWNFRVRAGLAIAAMSAGYCIFVALAMHPANAPLAPVLARAGMTVAIFAMFAWVVAQNRRFIERVALMARVDYESGAVSVREFERVADVETRRARLHRRELALVLVEAGATRSALSAPKSFLPTLVAALAPHARDGDVIARIAPRRFAVLLVECSAAEGLAISEAMRETLRTRFDPTLELRLGIAHAGAGSPSAPIQLLERAQRHIEPVSAGPGAPRDKPVGDVPGPVARVMR